MLCSRGTASGVPAVKFGVSRIVHDYILLLLVLLKKKGCGNDFVSGAFSFGLVSLKKQCCKTCGTFKGYIVLVSSSFELCINSLGQQGQAQQRAAVDVVKKKR